jgi:Zn-finger protein
MDGSMGHQIPGGKIRKERKNGSTVHACSDFKATLHSSGSSTIKLRIKKKAQEGRGHSQNEIDSHVWIKRRIFEKFSKNLSYPRLCYVRLYFITNEGVNKVFVVENANLKRGQR